jgi:voltage-dependent calcium channel N type alpha-1B
MVIASLWLSFLILYFIIIFITQIFFRVRIGLHWFVTRPFFDGFIMFVILLSSVALALEDPVNEDSDRNKKLGLLDYGFTAIFAIECLLKMLDLGMFLHPGAYLRDVWNVMDISVVSCAILSFYFK